MSFCERPRLNNWSGGADQQDLFIDDREYVRRVINAHSAASLVLLRFGFRAFFSTGAKNFPV
jgi:hypothetical protein